MTTDTHWLSEFRLGALAEKLNRLNRRAAKLGLPGVSYQIVGEELRKVRTDIGVAGVVRYVEVAFSGQAPVVAGYTFLARVEHTDAGNIVCRAPGARDESLDLSAYRTAENVCEHCHTRRARKDTFVLQGEDGSLLQVGRNCLADYCRSKDVSVAISLWTLLSDVSDWAREDADGEPRGARVYAATEHYVACALASIRQRGWTSRAAARNDYSGTRVATASDARNIAYPPPSGVSEAERQAWREAQPNPEDARNAKAALTWVSALKEQATISDYESNLVVACALGYVEPKHEGIVASAAAAYLRQLDRLRQAERDRQDRTDEYYGEVKQRIELELTVVRRTVVEGYYGLSTLLLFEDAERRTFKWFASGERDESVGDRVVVRGTVKAHETYRDRKQTVLTRCRVSEVRAAA